MAEKSNLNIGIISVKDIQTANLENDLLGQHLEELLSSQKYFKILSLKRRSSVYDLFKLKFLIEDWSEYENIDLIFVVGNFVLPLTNVDEDLCLNCKQFPHICKLMTQKEEIESLLCCRYKCDFFLTTLVISLKLSLEKFEAFFENMALDILLAHQELKKSKTSFPSITKTVARNCNLSSKVKPIKVAERPRQSLFEMISISEALECVLKMSKTLKTTWKSFEDSLSFVLAEDVLATEPYPPFNASIKDGYAALADDNSTVRDVIGVVTPGCKLDFDIKHGTCIRVSTGSAIPNGADCVIQVEDTKVAEKDLQGNELKIEILKLPKKLQDIRTVGTDVCFGEVLIPSKQKISAAEIGILAICGIQRVLVFQKPTVALLSTGDEVMDLCSPLQPGCIRDSNKYSLLNLLKENRIPFIDAGISKDTVDDFKSHLTFALESADVVVTTGSVSMGEKDFLKSVLEQDFDAVIHFGRVHMKPGKPATFSTVNFNNKEKIVFSLPGNPVSAYVCFYLFVIPCIKKLMGYENPKHTVLQVEIAHDIKLDERPEFFRVSLKPGKSSTFIAHSTGGQQSSRLLSMQNADALLILPSKTPEKHTLEIGSKVDAILLKAI